MSSPVEDMKKAAADLVWEDKEVDIAKAKEIIEEHHPDGKFTLLSSVEPTNGKPMEEAGLDDELCIEFDPAIFAIMQFFQKKYGKEKGMLINVKLTRELFFAHLDHIN